MLQVVPNYVHLLFFVSVLIAFVMFMKATNSSKISITIMLFWITFQSILGISHFYTYTQSIPPRFLLLIAPPVFLIVLLFITAKGRLFIDSLNINFLMLLHSVRIIVELVLYFLFCSKQIPINMTFEGGNFDMFSGITAPLIYYFGFVQKKLNTRIILFWNFLCLTLLINVVVNSVLSSPFPFQKFGFEQPNIAVLYFPYVLLPSFIVPLVLFSHLTIIRKLTKRN